MFHRTAVFCLTAFSAATVATSAPRLAFAQETVPTANAPQGVPQQAAPGPAPDTVSGPGKDHQSARKAIMDRMRECMKGATSSEERKVCRDEMRKSRQAIHEEKKTNPKKKK